MKKIIFLFLVFFLWHISFTQEKATQKNYMEAIGEKNPVAVWVEYNNKFFPVIRRDFQTWEAHVPYAIKTAEDSTIDIKAYVWTYRVPHVPINISLDSISREYVEMRKGSPIYDGLYKRAEYVRLTIQNRNGFVFSWREKAVYLTSDTASSAFIQGIPIPLRVKIKTPTLNLSDAKTDIFNINFGMVNFEGTIWINIDAFPMYKLNVEGEDTENQKNPSAP